MNLGESVFSQLMEFLPSYPFRLCVDRHQGHRYVKSFSCWDQFLCLAFAQLTHRASLRDIEVCLRAEGSKLYHLGFRGAISRATLAYANPPQADDWRIFADFAQGLIQTAGHWYHDEPFGVELDFDGVRLRLHHPQFMFVALSVGPIPPPQKCAQAACAAGPARQHPDSCFRHQRPYPRGQSARSMDARSGRVGPWNCSSAGSNRISICRPSMELPRTPSRLRCGWPWPFTPSWPSSKNNFPSSLGPGMKFSKFLASRSLNPPFHRGFSTLLIKQNRKHLLSN